MSANSNNNKFVACFRLCPRYAANDKHTRIRLFGCRNLPLPINATKSPRSNGYLETYKMMVLMVFAALRSTEKQNLQDTPNTIFCSTIEKCRRFFCCIKSVGCSKYFIHISQLRHTTCFIQNTTQHYHVIRKSPMTQRTFHMLSCSLSFSSGVF